MEERFDISRFEAAQANGVYERALAEIKQGQKQSHWMWYIFPQLRGFGRTGTSRYYGISGREEAEEYLAHPVLGARLREISQALMTLEENDPKVVFDSPDWLKLRSCMTLFDFIAPNEVFHQVLEKYYGGKRCMRSVRRLEDSKPEGRSEEG